jgi:hypothetical protein
VNKAPRFVRDDEDDTQLFNRWQELVLEHCPNPDRIGCFDHETLRTFVENPSALDLTDPKYIHITECAECTRELQELRSLREARLSESRKQNKRRVLIRWQWTAALGTCVIIVVIAAFLSTKNRGVADREEARNVPPIPVTVDLSRNGASRDAAQDSAPPAISLPCRLIDLHLILPYYSPGGTYRVSVASERTASSIKAEGSSSAVSHGAKTEIQLKLDLRGVAPGKYYLGTLLEGDGAPYYYPLTLSQ